MSEPKITNGWKVRVVVPGALLHFVSATEPIVVEHRGVDVLDGATGIAGLEWTPTEEGDTAGYIDWEQVVAVTWRAGQ